MDKWINGCMDGWKVVEIEGWSEEERYYVDSYFRPSFLRLMIR